MMMDFLKPEFVVTVALVVARLTGLFLIAPLMSNRAVPTRAKIAVIVIMALIMIPGVPAPPSNLLLYSNLALMVAIFQEVTLGLIVGFAAYLTFAAVQVGGELIGMQLGFSMATLFDPANEGASGIMTTFYVVLGALIFLSLDGHHLMLGGIAKSFQIIPAGAPFEIKMSLGLVEIITKIFAVGIQISVPLLVVLTLLNFIFGFINKLSPQMNIYFNTGFILGPAVGIIVLIVSLPLCRVMMGQLTEGLEPDLIKLLKALKGS